MIPEDELEKAISIARKYDVEKLYLIGSALYEDHNDVMDYDFAVKGVPSGRFFSFYGELMHSMSKNVDLIDLSGDTTKFKSLIIRDGKLGSDIISPLISFLDPLISSDRVDTIFNNRYFFPLNPSLFKLGCYLIRNGNKLV